LPAEFILVQKIKAQLLPMLFILLLAILAGLPLFRGKLLKSHDSLFYPPRLTVFYAGLSEGKFLPRWTQEFAGGFGEPYFNFNAPLLYYLSACFQRLGFGQINSLNFSLFVLLLAAGLAMYLLASEFFGKAGGVVAATAYLFAPFTLLDLYVRGSYAEFSGLPFVPLTLWLFYKAARTERIGYSLCSAIAFALMLLTNNTVSLMVSPILGLWIFINALHKRSLLTWLRGVGGLLLGLMLTAFFWLPSLLEKSFVKTESLIQGDLNYQIHFIDFWQLLTSPWGYGFSVAGDKDGLSFQIGYAHIALTIAAIYAFVKPLKSAVVKQRIYLAYFFSLILLAIFFSTPISMLVWQQVKLLQYLQFPWRFLILLGAATSFLSGAVCLLASNHSRLKEIVSAAAVAIILLFNFSHATPQDYYKESDEDFSSSNIISKGLEVSVAREFRPIWVISAARTPPYPTLIVTDTNAQYVELYHSSTKHKFRVEGQRQSLLRLNIHYFPGWKIFIDGAETPIDLSNQSGLIYFSVPAGVHDIEARFMNTPVRTAAEFISLAGLILLLLAFFYFRKPRAKPPADDSLAKQS
jgi:hypothetical protein